MYFSLQCKPALKNVLQLTIIFAWIVLVLGCSEKEFNCKDYDAAAHHLQARGEGAYDLPAEMKELSVTHQAYITQHEEQGRLILFVLWRGRTHNLRGALRVSDDFDVDEIERGFYSGQPVITLLVWPIQGPPGTEPHRYAEVRIGEKLCRNWYYVIRDLD